jgi:hypothetical protein
MTAVQLLEVREAEDETPCRACPAPIRPGQRMVLVQGRGNVHLRCLVILATDSSERRNANG